MRRRPRLAAYAGYVAIAALARVASYGTPPSRDMGQYMYIGGEVLDGAAPYAEIANNKGPANYALWAVLRALCGESPAAVRIVLVLATGLAALAVAGYVARYAGPGAGLLAGVVMSVLSGAVELEAFDPNNAQFGLVAMAGAWGFAAQPDRSATILAGVLAAVSALLNPAFAMVVPFVAWEACRVRAPGERLSGLALAALGAVGAAVPFALWILITGAADDFRIQVFGQVSRSLAPDAAGGGIPGVFESGTGPPARLAFLVDLPNSVLWLAGFAGACVAARERHLRPAAIAALVWMALVIVRVEAASYVFPNQYVPALAGIAVGISLGIASLWGDGRGRRIALAALVLAGPVWAAVVAPQLREMAIPADQRGNTYVAAAVDFVRANTPAGSTLTVVGYDPEVQWLSDRRAPTRFFDAFGLSSRADYAAERRRDLFDRPPAAIVALADAVVDRDVQALIDDQGYTLAYDQVTRIWLRSR